MKILIMTECYPSNERPQYGIFIKQQVDELKKLNYEVDIVIPKNGSAGNEINLIKEKLGAYYLLPYRSDRYELFLKPNSYQLLKKIIDKIDVKKYDLIAVHITSDTILKTAILLGEEYDIPVVQHYHGLNVWKNYIEKHPIRAEWYAKRRKKLLEKATAIVCVSQKVSEIVRQRMNKNNVYTVYNGVDLSLFENKRNTKEEKDKLTIVTVGNLIPIKGIQYLIEAFAKLYAERSNIMLEIIGEGVMRTELEQKVQKLGITEVVVFSGRLPYNEVAEHMQQSDIFVLPSFYEAIGCVYLEAMGCGIPVIGIQGMGIDEIIVDGENGMLVEAQDIASLYMKMKILVDDRKYANEIGVKGRITAEQYTWAESALQLNKVYKKCVER